MGPKIFTIGAVLEHKAQYGSLREKIAAESAARRARYSEFSRAFELAHKAGLEAGRNAMPTPMLVMAGDKVIEHVSEGACGFAWVRVRPATSSFARWLVKNKLAHKAYRGGVDIWISDHNQSVTRKEAHARAMATILNRELGIDCYANSRLD
jgi:hypothetical protein